MKPKEPKFLSADERGKIGRLIAFRRKVMRKLSHKKLMHRFNISYTTLVDIGSKEARLWDET